MTLADRVRREIKNPRKQGPVAQALLAAIIKAEGK